MNIFAHGLDWNPGDEVLIAHYEHPGGTHVYRTLEQRRGIRIKWLELPSTPESAGQIVDIYRRAFTPRTKLIVVSHVLFVTGVRMPVEELAALARANGALISVDGAQAFGLLPLNLAASGVDHYAGSGQKWILAGTGTGFTFIRKELQRRVWPAYGFDDIDVPPKYKIGRYEKCGQPNIPAWLGLGAAIELQRELGPKNIEARALDLTRLVRLALEKTPGVKLYTPADPRLSAALTTFSIDDVAPETIVRTLIDDDKVYTRTIVEHDVAAVRVSTHFYNTPAEVLRLVESLNQIASRRAAA
jgi:selenocysteine lyase/cysteine desulfurase